MSQSEFMPFPQERVAHSEAHAEAQKPYQSPHHPNRKQAAASGLAGDMGAPKPAVSPDVPMKPVAPENSVTPNSEAEGVSLELPSRFAFYPFKDVYAKPFKGRNLRKLIRAREEESTLHLVEAVSSVLSSTSGVQNIGFQLTPADFYFVLYWLRINSFTKSAIVHNTVCTNSEHLEQVAAGKVPADSLNHSEIIHKSSLTTNMLDEVPDPSQFKLEYPGVSLRIPVMLDGIQMTEDARIGDPEFSYAARLASYLSTPTPTTLDQRIAIIDDMSGDDIQAIELYEKATSKYGIEEKVRWTCKTCNHTRIDDIELNTHNFFPSAA